MARKAPARTKRDSDTPQDRRDLSLKDLRYINARFERLEQAVLDIEAAIQRGMLRRGPS